MYSISLNTGEKTFNELIVCSVGVFPGGVLTGDNYKFYNYEIAKKLFFVCQDGNIGIRIGKLYVGDLFYVDDTITIEKKNVLAICNLIVERGIKISFKILIKYFNVQIHFTSQSLKPVFSI